MHKLIIISIILLGLSSSCKILRKEDGGDGEGTAITEADLRGTWTTDCIPTDDGHAGESHVDYLYDDDGNGSLEHESSFYADSGCSTATRKVYATYAYKLGDPAEGLDTAVEIDLELESLEVAYYEDSVAEANESVYYGYQEWATGERIDIAGKKRLDVEDAEPEEGTESFGLADVVDNERFIGLSTTGNDGSTDAERPTTLNGDIVYRKL